ncbi:hypothetical protein EML15_03575 [Corynebacterium sp. sy017]|uniref:hypothetical protein n=1 Tax=unclassified Corynebacterium TaxID=2624378 RepID=UPI0011870196|nr:MULTISPECIES: hypothetical protein [unclassified Corynebacterium]MBP3088228.1 hypothetical protein [Corynebacterium sp. sy017]QDZ43416.1 hypothetical protein FQV43_09875 [Corynebacterium sp. sy039]TSD91559.1 hypothetical protein ELY17_03575 [Corynebacterium sp. SY003]
MSPFEYPILEPDQPEHPENDLRSDADYANRYRPQPQTFDELADQPDPVAQAAANKRSTKQAIIFACFIPLLTAVLSLLSAMFIRHLGGIRCESNQAVWLCTHAAQVWWPILTSAIPVSGTLICAYITYHKYKNYLRWRPWMGTFWALITFSMVWMTSVLQISITAH